METPLNAAKRELQEETENIADSWEEIGVLYDYPTKDTNCIHVFLAENIKKVSEQDLDISEDIKFDLIGLDEVQNLVMNGEICVSGSIAAIFKAIKTIEQRK